VSPSETSAGWNPRSGTDADENPIETSAIAPPLGTIYNHSMQNLVLQSRIDESSDRKQEDVFCVGGLLANPQHLAAMQNAWVDRLRRPDEIAYFRATECKGVHGAFFELRKKYGSGAQAVADKIRADLEAILLSHHWIGFGIGILIPDYREIRNSVPIARRFYPKDPTELAYSGLFFEIARAVQKKAPEYQVAYIIDDSAYSGIIAEALRGLKINHPEVASAVATLAPQDDKLAPPLQMADLLASMVKDIFLQWLASGKPEHVPLEMKWLNHIELIGKWDKEHMLTTMVDTLNDPRYGAGLLAQKPLPQPTKQVLKRREKRKRPVVTVCTKSE
jgi:hypothetical protein